MSSIFDSPLFETLLSITLVFAILSVLASSMLEIINSYFNHRGKMLYETLSRLFDDKINVNLGQMLYAHPMIMGLRKDKNTFPQYISDAMFSQVIIELISNSAREFGYDEGKQQIVLNPGGTENLAVSQAKDLFSMFEQGVNLMEHTSLKMMLLTMAEKSAAMAEGGNSTPIANLENQLKQWYNDQSDRMTGWFKDSIKKKLRIIGFLIAITLNIDAIHVFQTIYLNPTLRSELVALSEQVAQNYGKLQGVDSLTETQRQIRALQMTNFNRDGTDTTQLMLAKKVLAAMQHFDDSVLKVKDSARAANIQAAYERIDELESLGLPIGWKQDSPPLSWFNRSIAEDSSKTDRISRYFMGHRRLSLGNILFYILGICITAIMVSMGAPFWFELLLKAVNLRSAGKKPVDTTKS